MTLSPFHPQCPRRPGERIRWGRLYGSSTGLAICCAARIQERPVVVLTADTPAAARLEQELLFFGGGVDSLPVRLFPDWETLPYDAFSPHQDIVSQRLETLYQLLRMRAGILIVPVATLMHRLVPREYISMNSLILKAGDRTNPDVLRRELERKGYACVPQVMEHGEFAVRGSLIDLFPMGSSCPFRVDLFDDEVESIRMFDPENQRSSEHLPEIRLLPAREFPLTEETISRFRQGFRAAFEGNPQNTSIYRDVSNGLTPQGIEYYLPLFFEHTESLFDYLPADCLMICCGDVAGAATHFQDEARARFSQHNSEERPLLAPERLFLDAGSMDARLGSYPLVLADSFELEPGADAVNFNTTAIPRINLSVSASTTRPAEVLQKFIASHRGRLLFVAETPGRREVLLEMLSDSGHRPQALTGWQDFLEKDSDLGITVAPLEHGLRITAPELTVIAEAELFGEQAMQRRRRRPTRDSDTIIRNLTELAIGAPVVHEEHGVGRYQGLQTLQVGDLETEFLVLEYADGDRLYVPVFSLHLISRYAGASPDMAPLHKLGGEQWRRAKQRAARRVRDVAVELLDIYARRAARKGYSFPPPGDDYAAFAAAFPFEETPDQEQAICDVLEDMCSDRPMDRLICGDVGFGKTEVAMRAAFVAAQAGRQVVVLVPTTLLAQQHYQNFCDRFADWPVNIEMLSRFRSGSRQSEILEGLRSGAIDIIIGTHKLLRDETVFHCLGLIIIDEEHRFGVRQKEKLKSLRSEVDVLTLTATPIPRTLNMALSDLRELSIIATPPVSRLAIKTFMREWQNMLVYEACLREIRRGGQVYLLHNEIKSIDRMAQKISELVPEASVRVAHGKTRERDLEQIMLDFYHQRFNVLVCTTIIETGIDVPSANTIIINRADKFGLAQLYQLRGRVGRSHHRAYAYLIVPPRDVMTADALKRLEAIESLEELGTGFMLATHDLEIRGAGELLGEDQSGQMNEIGFVLYTDLLQRAVTSLKSGSEPDLDKPLGTGAEIDLHVPALIPSEYLPDVHSRLIMYKRIASADSPDELRELQVEMIDRFGLLPDELKTLFNITELKVRAMPLGILRIEAGPAGGRILFGPETDIDPSRLINLIQTQPQTYRMDGQDRLRFIMKLPDEESRIGAVSALLDNLETRNAA